MNVQIGSFNVTNLAAPGVPFYENPGLTQEEFEVKADWIAGQLRLMDVDLCGFQEVFDEEALRNAVSRSGLYSSDSVFAPLTNGESPRVGVACRLPILSAPEAIEEFPDHVDLSMEDVRIPVHHFSRPVLRMVVELPTGLPATVFVVHLKSKRPIVDPALEHDPTARAIGQARALIVRAAESAALRAILVSEMRGNDQPVIVVGDLNDLGEAVTTRIITGNPPHRFLDRARKQEIWDVLLYNAYEIQARRSMRDVRFSHIFNGEYDTLDHVLVSQEFHRSNPYRVGEVEQLRFYNDHLIDDTLTPDPPSRVVSDHGQVVCTITLLSLDRIRTLQRED